MNTDSCGRPTDRIIVPSHRRGRHRSAEKGSRRDQHRAGQSLSTGRYAAICALDGGRERTPTGLRSGPYRFYFYASDGAEPAHVHVERDDESAKLWLDPVRLHSSGGYGRRELNQIQRPVEENRDELLRSRNEFFDA
ncbi:MAG: DUF4160 domain-containing protein [Candidatus Binatia bacterium]